MAESPSNKTARIFMVLIAVAGLFGLLIQFPLTLANCRALGMTTVAGIITYFSFFTIDTNLLAVIGLSFPCTCQNPLGVALSFAPA